MTDKTVLLELARRCETEEPSRELNEAIALTVGTATWGGLAHAGQEAPRYTTSLDAAVTLVPSDLLWMVGAWHDAHRARVADVRTVAKTSALALCAAALRARAELAARDRRGSGNPRVAPPKS